MVRVRATEAVFVDNCYRPAGAEFEYSGPLVKGGPIVSLEEPPAPKPKKDPPKKTDSEN